MSKTSTAQKTEKSSNKELLRQINTVIEEKIRPFLHADGGDMEVIKLHEDGVLDIQLVGACGSCPSAMMTLSFGVQQILDEHFPEANIQINPL